MSAFFRSGASLNGNKIEYPIFQIKKKGRAMPSEFLEIQCRSYKIVHGFDGDNQEIVEQVTQSEWIPKIVDIGRIQNVTEKWIRMNYSHDRIIYWEYKGGLEAMRKVLKPRQLPC